jgi:hypothetical protein
MSRTVNAVVDRADDIGRRGSIGAVVRRRPLSAIRLSGGDAWLVLPAGSPFLERCGVCELLQPGPRRFWQPEKNGLDARQAEIAGRQGSRSAGQPAMDPTDDGVGLNAISISCSENGPERLRVDVFEIWAARCVAGADKLEDSKRDASLVTGEAVLVAGDQPEGLHSRGVLNRVHLFLFCSFVKKFRKYILGYQLSENITARHIRLRGPRVQRRLNRRTMYGLMAVRHKSEWRARRDSNS